jgi:hypothetical protein
LKIVLKTLREHNLYVNFDKRDFYQKKIEYLGHVMSEDGIAVYPGNITTIMEWPIPKDIPNITSYYRRFIEHFPKISHPITSLQKKGMKFNWSKIFQANFDKLKGFLTTTPILKVVDLVKDITIYVDTIK